MQNPSIPRQRVLSWLGSTLLSICIASVALAEIRLEFPTPAEAQLEILTDKLPLADADRPYAEFLEASEDWAGLRWAVSGELPPGLHLDRRSGELYGVPHQPGVYRFDIELSDDAGRSDRKSFEFHVLDYIRDVDQLPPSPPAPDGGAATPGKASVASALSARSTAQTAPPQPASATSPDLSGVLDILEATAEGDWVRVNLNFFQDVWAPRGLQPLRAWVWTTF